MTIYNNTKYLDLIENSSVYDVALKTPLHNLSTISETYKNQIFLKREDLQITHSAESGKLFRGFSGAANMCSK